MSAPPETNARAVEQLARDVAALARERKAEDLAGRIDAELRRRESSEARVVVVGEANRGKSSLVNALIGADELSPVSPDIATSCHIVIRAGRRPRAVAHPRDGRPRMIPFAELSDYAAATGRYAETTKAVEVELDSPLLKRGVTLIDTPGVGGLTAGHNEITRAALLEADALLFVLDAESEISAPEVEFLRLVTERVASVIFTFGKIDDYPDWRSLLDSTRARLPKRFAQYPVIGVSSERRQRARKSELAGDAARAQELYERSGFAALEAELERAVINRVRQLRLLNVLAVSRSGLEELARPDLLIVKGAEPGADQRVAKALLDVKTHVAAASAAGQEVALELEALRLQLGEEYERRARDIDRRYRQRIREWDDSLVQTLPGELQSELDGLAGALNAIVLEGIAEIDQTLVERFGVATTELDVWDEGQGVELPPLEFAGLDRAPTAKVRRTQLLLAGGFAGGRLGLYGGEAAAALLAGAALTTLTAGVVVVGAVAGIAVASFANRKIDAGAGREQARVEAGRLLNEALAEARLQLMTPLGNRILALRREFQADVEARLKARQESLDAEHKRMIDLAAQETGVRQAAKNAARERVKPLQEIKVRLDVLVEALAEEPAA